MQGRIGRVIHRSSPRKRDPVQQTEALEQVALDRFRENERERWSELESYAALRFSFRHWLRDFAGEVDENLRTGVRVRFFNVMIPTDPRVVGKSIGKALIAVFQPRNFNANSGAIVRNCPLATRAMRATPLEVITVARGSSSPAARKASTASEPNALSSGGSVQGSFTRSARPTLRRRDQGFSVAATTN